MIVKTIPFETVKMIFHPESQRKVPLSRKLIAQKNSLETELKTDKYYRNISL